MDLSTLTTELPNPRTAHITTLPTLTLLSLINAEDSKVGPAILPSIPVLASAIDAITPLIRAGGRLIYVGAGTSGRLGVLDASEIPPTFSAPPEQFVGLIAGGDVALRNAVEGAEDDAQGGRAELEGLDVGEGDAVIGIAASGRTPYVLGCLEFARGKGCVTVGVACVASSAMGRSVDFMVEVVTGPEVVAGSTRMKAGTATKLVLNMLSTGIMIRCGKTFGNVMIDLKPTNVKLRIRARRILRTVCGDQCRESDDELDQILSDAGGSVKVAAAMILLGVPVEEARIRLEASGGVLENIIVLNYPVSAETIENQPRIVLCVDGGGSKCRAAIAAPGQPETWSGEAGPCNPNDMGIEGSIAAIRSAIVHALDTCEATRGRTIPEVRFAEISLGLAGIDREPTKSQMLAELTALFGEDSTAVMTVANDVELLARIAGSRSQAEQVIVLVAGTGSICVRYKKNADSISKVRRAGGYGALLGDDGSGFDMGRKAVRMMLGESYDNEHWKRKGEAAIIPSDTLLSTLAKRFSWGEPSTASLLDSVLVGSMQGQDVPDPARLKRRIAACAKVVVDHYDTSKTAQHIVCSAAEGLARLVWQVLLGEEEVAKDCILVLAGGLMQSPLMRKEMLARLKGRSTSIGSVEHIEDLAIMGAAYLAEKQDASGTDSAS